MADVTLARIDEMEAIFDGIARRARAALGVSAWGMQVMTLPPNWDGYPNHSHDTSTEEAARRRSTSRSPVRRSWSRMERATSWSRA